MISGHQILYQLLLAQVKYLQTSAQLIHAIVDIRLGFCVPKRSDRQSNPSKITIVMMKEQGQLLQYILYKAALYAKILEKRTNLVSHSKA